MFTLATRGGAPPAQVSMRIIGALLIANRALNGLEIERRSNPQKFFSPLAQAGIDAPAPFFSRQIISTYITSFLGKL